MKILITICARGGSKGIPGKNIKLLHGKPLIYYSIDVAAQFQELYQQCDIVLSTDSEEIRDVVKNFASSIDAEYIRPAELATDKAGKIGVIKDVLRYSEDKYGKQYDCVLDLDVTAPLRNVTDLTAALDLLQQQPDALNIFSVSPANKNPYFNMVEEKEDGYFGLCKTGSFLSRQAAPRVFEMNASFYIYRKEFFEQGQQSAITGRSLIYEVPHICFDLDHPIDFEFLSYLMANNKLDFKI